MEGHASAVDTLGPTIGQIGVDRRSVRRWKSATRKGGEAAAAAKPAAGRPRRLTVRDLRRLRRLLIKGAVAAGLPTELWTCPRVSWLINREFDVHYHPAHVSRLLHGLGFSPQKPTRRSLERDEERIQAWIAQDLLSAYRCRDLGEFT